MYDIPLPIITSARTPLWNHITFERHTTCAAICRHTGALSCISNRFCWPIQQLVVSYHGPDVARDCIRARRIVSRFNADSRHCAMPTSPFQLTSIRLLALARSPSVCAPNVRARINTRIHVYVAHTYIYVVQFRRNWTREGNAAVGGPRKYQRQRGRLLFGPAYGRACDRACTRFCQMAGVPARNTPEECTPTLRRTPFVPRILASPSRPSASPALDHRPRDPPSVPPLRAAESGTRRGTRGISANSMLSRCPGGEVCEGGSHWGAICGEAFVRLLRRSILRKIHRASVEKRRLIDTFLINTSSVWFDKIFFTSPTRR